MTTEKRNRREVLAGIGGAAAAAGRKQAPAAAASGQQPPNIVIFQFDDMRSADWRVLRRTRKQLRGARRFPNYIVGYSYCAPSRASLLTGLYSHNHGVVSADSPTVYAQWQAVSRTRGSLGSVLKSAGYRTATIGKYMNGYEVRDRPEAGWDHWVTVDTHAHFGVRLSVDGDVVQTPKDVFSLRVLAQYASEFVASTPVDEPFFLLFSPVEPHGPIAPEPRTQRLFTGVTLPRTACFNEADVSDKPAYVADTPAFDQQGILGLDEMNRGRMRMLTSADEVISGLLKEMHAAGRLDNAAVFIVSDNGYMLGEHRLTAKHAPYTPSTVIPMLAWGKAFRAGEDQRIVSNVDIAPTCVQLAGARMPPADGISLLGKRRRDFVPMMRNGYGALPGEPGAGRGVRSRELLYYELHTGERELYDLRVDPMELNNLLPPGFAGEAYPPGLPNSSALRDLTELYGSCRAETCSRSS